MPALQTQEFPSQAELLIDIKINLKIFSLNFLFAQEIIADKIHAFKERFELFLHDFILSHG
jgi:hypothetical protein